jgi:hypothetical protein
MSATHLIYDDDIKRRQKGVCSHHPEKDSLRHEDDLRALGHGAGESDLICHIIAMDIESFVGHSSERVTEGHSDRIKIGIARE